MTYKFCNIHISHEISHDRLGAIVFSTQHRNISFSDYQKVCVNDEPGVLRSGCLNIYVNIILLLFSVNTIQNNIAFTFKLIPA